MVEKKEDKETDKHAVAQLGVVWLTPVIPGGCSTEDCWEFETSLGYKTSSRPA